VAITIAIMIAAVATPKCISTGGSGISTGSFGWMIQPNLFIYLLTFLSPNSRAKVERGWLKVLGRNLNTAKETSIIAISAALYAVFFLLSYLIAVPNFTILYLPIILLGVFPIWFGLSGLTGSMIGAVIGGLFVENLGFFAWIEIVTTFIIYTLNWFLTPKNAAQVTIKKKLFVLLGVYALTLFLGTSYILWQFTFVGLIPAETALILLLPTFTLNYVIEAVVCPALIRTLSPKLKSWGIYSGNFWEWWKQHKVEA
jgi:hypothetical protein